MSALVEVAEGVWGAEQMGNWYLVVEGDRAIAVDAGMPGDVDTLERGLEQLGRPKLVAVLLTHGHVDHIGFAEHARTTHGAEVHALAAEEKLIAHPLPGPKTERSPLAYLKNPSARQGTVALLRGRSLRPKRVHEWTRAQDGTQLDHLPGAPRFVATPGHTPGHASIHLTTRDAVVAGDALVTFDPYTGRRGPRLMALGSTNDAAAARASLDRLAALEATTLLPGHGPPWTQGVAAAAERARSEPQG